MYGKAFRLSRLINPLTQKVCLVPIDHGTTLGPIKGLGNYIDLIGQLVEGGADGIVLHKGLLKKVCVYPHLTQGRYWVHLSASTILSRDATHKVLVCTVEEAIQLGADGISVHINLGSAHESDMIKKLGHISKACNEWGMPLLAMMYPHKEPKEAYHIIHAARFGEELGADVIKVDYPGSVETMEELTRSVQVPVLIAGGSPASDKQLLSMVNDALAGGAAGVSIGRGIFQHRNPRLITQAIRSLVHGTMSLEGCLDLLQQTKPTVAL